MFEALLIGFANVFGDSTNLLLLLFGAALGIVIGALPGFGATTGLVLLFPITVMMELDPVSALLLLIGAYVGAEYGGSISSILINVPGTSAAVCTAFDGYPMANNGRGKEALYTSVTASCIGGIFGGIVLMFFAPPLATLALKFGPAEKFWLAILGLTLIGTLATGNMIKGLASGAIGLLLSTVGIDPVTGHERFTFGWLHLRAGFPYMVALLAFFAVPQVLSLLQKDQATGQIELEKKAYLWFKTAGQMIKFDKLLLFKSSIIGTIVGILPGAGASIASFLAYGEAKRSSKHPEQFGTGCREGIVAAESANNAMVGGSLVPLLSFGIPGNAASAVLLGALATYGLIPGGALFRDRPEIVYSIFIGVIVAAVVILIWGLLATRIMAKILEIKPVYTIGPILILVTVGAYVMRYQFNDLIILLVVGILAFFFLKANFSLPAIILGLILGGLIEDTLRQSLVLGNAYGGIWLYYFSSPITVILMLTIVLVIVFTFVRELKKTSN